MLLICLCVVCFKAVISYCVCCVLDVVLSILCCCRMFGFICCVIPDQFGLITYCFRFVCLLFLASECLCVEVLVFCVVHSCFTSCELLYCYRLSVSVVQSRDVLFFSAPHIVVS